MADETVDFYYRACDLGFAEPSIKLFGRRYGVCPLKQPCPRNIVCGYARTRNMIKDDPND